MDKLCTGKRYAERMQKNALCSLNWASDWYRDTLRVEDLHEGDSVVGADSDDDASRASVIADEHDRSSIQEPPNLFHADGSPDLAHVPAPWTIGGGL